MGPVQKALWFVESHSRMGIDLERVARASCVSPYHLTRAFSEVFGVSLMRYARLRRLSEAARQIAAGAPDLLALALDCGYASHEAFTRAFKKELGITPEAVRSLPDLSSLNLMEPFDVNTEPQPELAPPRLEQLEEMAFAGLVERHDSKSPAAIPGQWQRFAPFLGNIPARCAADAYGLCFNFDDEGRFDYMCGVPVKAGASIPSGLVRTTLPAQKYAVFHHDGHIAEIRSVMAAIWTEALSDSGYEAAQGATLEKYSPAFNPATGLGGYEIWVAVQ